MKRATAPLVADPQAFERAALWLRTGCLERVLGLTILAIAADYVDDWHDRVVKPSWLLPPDERPSVRGWVLPHELAGAGSIQVVVAPDLTPQGITVRWPRQSRGQISIPGEGRFQLIAGARQMRLELGRGAAWAVVAKVDRRCVAYLGELRSWSSVAQETIAERVAANPSLSSEAPAGWRPASKGDELWALLEDEQVTEAGARRITELLLACRVRQYRRYDVGGQPRRRPNRVACARFGQPGEADLARITIEWDDRRLTAELRQPGTTRVKDISAYLDLLMSLLAAGDRRFVWPRLH